MLEMFFGIKQTVPGWMPGLKVRIKGQIGEVKGQIGAFDLGNQFFTIYAIKYRLILIF